MSLTTTKWDAADYLETADDAAGYLTAIMEEGDTSLFYAALGDIARSAGMTEVAERTGMSRESLYKALAGDRKPSFDTVNKVMRSLGLQLHAKRLDIAPPEPVSLLNKVWAKLPAAKLGAIVPSVKVFAQAATQATYVTAKPVKAAAKSVSVAKAPAKPVTVKAATKPAKPMAARPATKSASRKKAG